MSLSNILKGLFKDAAAAAVKKIETKSETFTFDELPKSVDELKALPEAVLDTPYKAAALSVLALCAYAEDPDAGIEMLNFVKGPQPLTPYEKQFLHDRLTGGKAYTTRSYLAGATPDNDYTPDKPYKLTVSTNPYSFDTDGYAVLWLTSGGADSARQVKLRAKGDKQWFLWEQYLLSDIRKPKSEDPWA
ncbi:MAG: hypothetical protein MJ088_00020 [Clostridia bacterium]|nr:hypothetical protein [Clostridia bacterium]